ncbi:GNAT family N-acetyltransferase [Winogradskyella undariae]|uniref:GNAT family N-acetyltransferase n=1 Tax=Winogradskyella TaxID=286104 RepID=UPI00156AC8E2|nr:MULTISPECIES: GNAT family N-acetyltransferase [Winogradskyella]NRR92739.1 GNAT family N-acetyltransferase [Winogradskyella undariae]QXP79779.1 GNAT family N-acetyltransferase [Winogradskyella sp. HaHa_3_26]
MIQIRTADLNDIPEITSVFRDTIINISTKHYSEKQTTAWASGADKIKDWEKRISKLYFIVAEIDKIIVGFAYLKNGNYLEGLFVHKDYQRQGVGSKLLRIMESQVMMNDFEVFKSDVSKTALPFFDNKYFNVIKIQKKSVKGVMLENYLVEKQM